MTKDLSKAITTISKLRNKYLNNKTEENRTFYVKQWNYCFLLLRKTKKMYYSNLEEKNVKDNKRFWKIVKPLLSDKLTQGKKKTYQKMEKS